MVSGSTERPVLPLGSKGELWYEAECAPVSGLQIFILNLTEETNIKYEMIY